MKSPGDFNLGMTIEEKSSSRQDLDQFRCLLDSLPVSRAALKKADSEMNNSDEYIAASFEKKIMGGDKDKDEELIVDLNDTLAEDVRKVPIAKSSRVLCSMSPISLLLELSQRNRDIPNVKWEEFCKNGLFGCKVDFGNNFWIVPAEYSHKKEAKTMVALMACTELMGDNILFESIELKKYESWTKASVRKSSDELFKIYKNFKDDSKMNSHLTSKCPQQSESTIINPIVADDGSVSYVSLVNEACQKLQIDLPIYHFSSEKIGSNLNFRCFIKIFSEFPDICSASKPSKRMAKNDAAKQIYEHMRMNEKNLDSGSKLTKQNVSLPGESSNEIIAVIKNLFNSAPDAPIDPVTLIPLLMLLLTNVSQSLYPQKSALDGIYEMIDQWKFFLEWKQQKHENTST